MQLAIDNAKRRFDIDIPAEIKRIKKDMNIEENGYPLFWMLIRRSFNKDRINKKLVCPMNYLYKIDLAVTRPKKNEKILPMSVFFKKDTSDMPPRHICRKVEQLIQNYSLELYNYNTDKKGQDRASYLLIRDDFESLMNDLKKIKLSDKYIGLMSWLIDRGFTMYDGVNEYNVRRSISLLNKNKSILMKVLYDLNKEMLLKCFSRNITENNSN